MSRGVGSAAIVATLMLLLGRPSPALACSPPFEPSIRSLGLAQAIFVGTTRERLAAGRVFEVERAWNVQAAAPTILIDFKEGPAVGDCSYPVAAGTRMLIAPTELLDGRFAADLATLQAPPDSELGRTYFAEAVRLYGPGLTPDRARPVAASSAALVADDARETDEPNLLPLAVGAALVLAIGFAAVRSRRRAT